MVYTGKPSRACATCKKRRIKCDEGRPSCGQCIKSKRECTGYKTEAELMFRDETRVTAQRAARKAAKAPPSPESSTSSTSSDAGGAHGQFGQMLMYNGPTDSYDLSSHNLEPLWDDSDMQFMETLSMSNPLWSLELPVSSPQPALSMTLHEQANAYFFNHFTLYGTEHSFHMYSILQELYKKADINDPIRSTTDAVSTLTLSRKHGYESLKGEAAMAYANAVRQVATAVADPVRVKEDETLLSVILLGFAETMDVSIASHPDLVPRFTMRPAERGIVRFNQAWGAHSKGASLIVKARGVEDMSKTSNSMHLAGFVQLQTIHRQMFIAQPMEDIDELWEPLANLQGRSPAFALQLSLVNIAIQIPGLRHRGLLAVRKPMEPGLGAELMELLQDTYTVDEQLRQMYMGAVRGKAFHLAGYYVDPLLGELDHERVWPGPVFNHDKLAVMNGMNMCRIFRLFMQMLIFNILERLIPPEQLKTHPEFITCRETIGCIVSDVCGTVPFGLGYLHDVPLSPVPMPNSQLGSFPTPDLKSDFVETFHEAERVTNYIPQETPGWAPNEGSGPAIGGWYLVWPLFVSCRMVSIPEAQKAWIRGRLSYIGETFGIAQAMAYRESFVDTYEPYRERRFMPLDFAPPPWQPLQ